MSGAVHHGRLREALRQRLYKGLNHDNVVYTHQSRYYIDCKFIQHPQVLDQKVIGNQAGGNVHGHQEVDGNRLSANQLLPGQHIGNQGSHQYPQYGGQRGTKHGVHRCGSHQLVFKDRLVTVCGKHSGPECNAAPQSILGIIKGYCYGIPEGIQHDNNYKHHDNAVDYMEKDIAEPEPSNSYTPKISHLLSLLTSDCFRPAYWQWHWFQTPGLRK